MVSGSDLISYQRRQKKLLHQTPIDIP